MEELINNLEKIFANLRKYGLTLNPNKCKFGLSEIAYVGHLINEKGISFSKEQLSKVTIIELPKKMSELKSFLGLASYFRNHSNNFAILSAPLTELTSGRNFTFVNNDPSPKVKRWKVLFQDYTFDIAYIRGEDNVVADVFSRACPERLPH